jgi:hypothetical protein
MRLGGGDDRDRGPPLQVVRQEEGVEEIFSILEATFELTAYSKLKYQSPVR